MKANAGRMNNRDFSVGIMAFNEENALPLLFDDLLLQKLEKFSMREVIVVASGCTDNTQLMAEEAKRKYPNVKLIIQSQREGKASAVKLFLKAAESGLLVLVSADVRVSEGSLERLLIPLLEDSVGMTVGRAMPVNSQDSFIGFSVNYLWHMHHQMSLVRPKASEILAMRNCVKHIDIQTAVDDSYLEAMLSKQGLAIKYVSGAVVYNKGPETLAEFFCQRERIYTGHLWLRSKLNYSVVSIDYHLLIKLLLADLKIRQKHFFWKIGVVLLEMTARINAIIKFSLFSYNPFVWKSLRSTKTAIYFNDCGLPENNKI
ncbi:MAG: glycosyltransferase [Candidatus Omnitrophota bacterium]|jgi:cellulose synthase/poly-beta-1,6-N-acetylglucosamine synthase-like glycosyltransferase